MNEMFIDHGLLTSQHLKNYCCQLSTRWAIITDSNLEDAYGKLLKEYLGQFCEVTLFSFSSGEQNKIRETKERLENQLLMKGFGRDIGILALGGGVVTDLVGFLASTYCRGVSLILLPTSLLGMVDAAIGGKNGVNTSFGKNLIGTMYFPSATFIDLDTLKTLPEKEIRNGFSEMVKHGLIENQEYFLYLEKHAQALVERQPKNLKRAIEWSIEIKKTIVTQDPFEKGKRRLLNFGHTIAHALEAKSNYQISHGEAVAIGMTVESYLSWQLGYLKKEAFDRICALIESLKLFTQINFPYSFLEFVELIKRDKKSQNQIPRFVLLNEIGRCLDFENQYCISVSEQDLEKAFNWMKMRLDKK